MDQDYVSYLEKKAQADREIKEQFIAQTAQYLRELGFKYKLSGVRRTYDRKLNKFNYEIIPDEQKNSTSN